MKKPMFITSWKEKGQPFTATGSGPETIKLLKRLASQRILAYSRQIGEPESKGGTYSAKIYGWYLQTLVRGKADK